MINFFEALAAQSDFMPHGNCFAWNPRLLWLHLGSDISTGLAYYAIAGALFYVYKRRDIPFHWVILLFGLFILACGTTHFMNAWTVYVPSYWLSGEVKALNAFISTITAFALFPLLPKILALPSLNQALNENALLNQTLNTKVIDLEQEISKHQLTAKALQESEHQLQILNKALERRVSERTSELVQRNKEAVALNQSLQTTMLDLQAANRRGKKDAEELRQANADLTSFGYSVSHDLRAPLRAISGFSQIINRSHRQQLDDEGQHYFENIIKASENMSALIDDLLRYSRIGRRAVQLQAVAIRDLIQDTLEILDEKIQAGGTLITLPDKMPVVDTDPTLIGEIFQNLIDNALTYRHPDKKPVIEIFDHIGDDTLTITIKDNGIGIAPEYQDKVFEIFQRLHSADRYPGTGIGLAIVHKAAQMLGSEITLESAIDQGCRFSITLPLHR